MSTLGVKARRDLGRNRPQVLAVIVTVFLGITLFGASYDAFRSLESSYDRLYEELGFADLWVTGGDTEAIAAAARREPDVAVVAARHQADVGLRPEGAHSLFGRIVGIPSSDTSDVNRLMILSGRYPERSAEALVEQHFASHFELEPGQTIEVTTPHGPQMLTISGTAASAEYVWPSRSRQDILTSPDDFGVVFVYDGAVAELAGAAALPQVMVRYSPGGDRAALDISIGVAARELGAVDVTTAATQPSNSALQEDVKGFGDLAFMFPVLFLTAAGLGTWVLLTRLVVAQQSVIGMLMANGVRRRAIFRHYLGFGIITGLGGAIPGVAAGALGAWAVADVYTDALSIPVTVVRIDATTPLIGLAFGLVAGALAALTPAWRATRLDPATAMRGISPTRSGRVTLAERLVPPLRRLPAGGRLVLRSVFRNGRRTASTTVGVVLALTLILTSWGMIDTVNVLVDRHFKDVVRNDAQVILDRPPTAAAVARVAAVPGVVAAEPMVQAFVSIEAGATGYATVLSAYDKTTEMRGFGDHSGGLGADGILLGEAMEDLLGVAAGDEVAVRLASGGASYRERVAGFVDEPMGTYAYTNLDRFSAHLGEMASRSPAVLEAGTVTPAVVVRLAAGVGLDEVRDELETVPGVVAVSGTRSLEATIRSYLRLFYAFVGVMLVFGGVLAFALVFNAMSVSLAERTVEIATLEAAGVTPRRLARLITVENLLVTAVGVAAGLPVGYWAASAFMAAYDSDQFSFLLEMRPSTLLLSAVFVLVVTLISQRPGLKALRRLDIAAVVRERAL